MTRLWGPALATVVAVRPRAHVGRPERRRFLAQAGFAKP